MAKRKTRSKRSSGNLPKGLPVGNSSINPFEVSHQSKRQKHDVHNRLPYKTSSPSKLADAVHRRRAAVKAAMSRKANTFEDKRLGEYDPLVSAQEKNLARLVRERSRRSARVEKYSLESSNEELTHGGKSIDKLSAADHVILSDDEEDYGNLDTSMHFGGGTQRNNANNTYGPAGAAAMDLKQVYADRKTDLDELILRRKVNKLERLKTKEEQEEAIEKMDETFDEFSEFLQFRDKESELCAHALQKRHGTLSAEDQEYADWDKEMKQYQFLERKVKATDRTKTAEEIARQAADQLHELETRRLARMNDDFENDALDDISDEEGCRVFKQMKRSKQQQRNHAEALDNDDDSENEGADDKPNVCFTADGLVEIDSHGNILRKVGQPAVADEVETDNDQPVYEVGDRVTACYHASERLDGQELWREGVITSVHKRNDQGTCYDIDYDDGDFEETVEPLSILPQGSEVPNVLTKDKALVDDQALKMKRNKAKVKARCEMPFVFEVPTTLEALDDLIGKYASTGKEASQIVRRIYKVNSVRLDRRNAEKMQNFYDVLLRRFVAIGDAVRVSGDECDTISRYDQLDVILETMYAMAHDSPECAAAVWGRRIGFFLNAHGKRLRDAELEQDEDFTAWPSTGVWMVLRAMGHIFPVTDMRHPVVTPAMLLLGQMIAHTPIYSMNDLVMASLCCGLLIEYSKDAKRVVPEALSFLASMVRMFSLDSSDKDLDNFTLPSLGALAKEEIADLRELASAYEDEQLPLLSLEKDWIEGTASEVAAALLVSTLHMIEVAAVNLTGSLSGSEKECFSDIAESLLVLKPKSKRNLLPSVLQTKAAAAVASVSKACASDANRAPLQRRARLSVRDSAVKSLAPRLENPDRYSFSKDKNKKAEQAALDRTRREFKREHKSVSRELRLDSQFFEAERRQQKDKVDSAAKNKRQRAFAWLEGEQAAMNQQVRQGGGLLQGGGMGAAKMKARSGKIGMKKGGKLK